MCGGDGSVLLMHTLMCVCEGCITHVHIDVCVCEGCITHAHIVCVVGMVVYYSCSTLMCV